MSIQRRKRNLVLVGMVESSHFKSWLKVVVELNLFDNIWIMPSDYQVNKFDKNLTDFESKTKIRIFHFPIGWKFNNIVFRLLDLLFGLKWRSIPLFFIIKITNPSFVHFHELQHGAYIFNSISNFFNKNRKFQTICSTWGSDLLFYGRLDSHKSDLVSVLSWCDTLTSERVDDFEVSKILGFGGKFYGPVYITVGAKFPLNQPEIPPSKRNQIIIKGYQDSHGRALNALAALEIIGASLRGIRIRVFSASQPVKLQIEFLKNKYGWDIEEIPRISNQELQKYFANSRLYIGLAISDGLSTSMIEAIKNGTFALQSSNSAANLFLKDGVTGFISDPWDLKNIAHKIQTALSSDDLVDNAVPLNFSKLKELYDYETGKEIIQKLYSL